MRVFNRAQSIHQPGVVFVPHRDVVAFPEQATEREERLPFTVSVVETDQALSDAFRVAQSAYQRHVPDLAHVGEAPPLQEVEPGYVVLIAKSKFDGSPIGTMKIQVNQWGRLKLEQSLKLPGWLDGCSQAGANRLGVASGPAGRMVKAALFKAFYLYCVEENIDWMVIAARRPLDKQYSALLFQDVFGPNEFIPLAHAANIPHRIMAFDVASAEERWHAARHPLHDFIFATRHPDIALAQHHLSLPLGEAVAEQLAAA